VNGSSSVLKGSEEEVGDILMTIDRGLYSKLKKLPGVNPLLFGNVEQQDEDELRKKISALERGEKIEDDVFEDESEDDEAESEEESDDGLTGEEKAKKKQLGRQEKDKKRSQAISAARAKKEDKDIDDKFIDSI
jgi:Ran GTPase-activating protein (RanGAP) involved in mRNA processing and transport